MTDTSTEQPGRGLRLAIAGASHWHLTIDARYLDLAREAGCEIVGLSDDDEALAKARAELAGCPYVLDPVELVERFKPDLVLAMPRPDRAPVQVGALLGLGVPLICEKPLGLSAPDVWPLAERASDQWAAVAFPWRYMPLWPRLRQHQAAGRAGDLVHLHLRLVKSSPERYIQFGVPWMLDTSKCAGGPLRNFGIHFADQLCWQLGDRQPRVLAATLTRNRYGHPIEDFGAALIRTADGVIATLEAGYTHAALGPGDGEVRLAAAGAYLVQRGTRLEEALEGGEPAVVEPGAGAYYYRDFFFDCLRRLRQDQPPPATIRDCALANELIDAAYTAAGEPPGRATS